MEARAATGPTFIRSGLLVMGLATLVTAAPMLTVTPDVKRMLAYSSMENTGLIATAAAAGTTLAIAAQLLHVLPHRIGKTIPFLAIGQLQAVHGSPAIADITDVLRRSRLIGVSLAVGVIVLLGLPPFAMFAGELAIARSLAQARLTWVLGAAALLVAVVFAALARNTGRILFGSGDGAARIAVPRTLAAALRPALNGFRRRRPLPLRARRGDGRLRDPGRPRARRADRTRPFPLLRRRRDGAAAQGATVVRAPGS